MNGQLEPINEEYEREYTPSRTETLREYEINIRFLSRGCVVRVGCKEIAFSDPEEAMLEINQYVKDPIKSQRKWMEILK